MGDVLLENTATQVLPHRKPLPSSIPNIDSLEGLGADGSDEYSTLKKLQRHLELVYRYVCLLKEIAKWMYRYIQLQEEYIKDEQRYGSRTPHIKCAKCLSSLL